MIQQSADITSRQANVRPRALRVALCLTAIMHASPTNAAAQSDEAPPIESLRFTPVVRPGPIKPMPTNKPANQSALVFQSDPVEENDQAPPEVQRSPLEVLSELMLIRAKTVEDPAPENEDPEGIEIFSLRFQESSSNNSIWNNPDAIVGNNRWEVLPALYLRSGRVLDVGYESPDYADLYAELGVDLTSNTGLWLRYERLRQALGSTREGEQRDADALYLQFELRF